MCFYINHGFKILLSALESYDQPCSPMDTTDDVLLPLVPLTVNSSDQSEIPHGTRQPEPNSSTTIPIPIIKQADDRLPKFVKKYFLSFKYFFVFLCAVIHLHHKLLILVKEKS